MSVQVGAVWARRRGGSHSDASQWASEPETPHFPFFLLLCPHVPRKARPPAPHPPQPHGTSAPGIWVLPWLQVVGECGQLSPCADAQPRASFLAFLHVKPCDR